MPDLSRGRALYKEPFQKQEKRSVSVHDRLYEDGVSDFLLLTGCLGLTPPFPTRTVGSEPQARLQHGGAREELAAVAGGP